MFSGFYLYFKRNKNLKTGKEGKKNMREIWTEYGVLFIGIFAVMLSSVLCQVLITVHMMKILKESETLEENMPKLLREWIEEYIKEKNQITNLSAFLDKKIEQISLGKYKITHLKHLSGQLILGMIFLAGMGACKGIIDGKTLGQILPFYIISILGVYLHFSLSGIMDIDGKKKIIHTNLTNFLENGQAKAYQETREKEKRENLNPIFGKTQDAGLKDVIREILA